jgi:transposase InsO family protein
MDFNSDSGQSVIWTDEGWLYLAVFLDLFSRMVVGWSMSDRITSELVVAAFETGAAQAWRWSLSDGSLRLPPSA